MNSTPNDHYRKLLQDLDDEAVANILGPIGFDDWQAAYACLQRIGQISEARSLFTDSLPALLLTLSEAAHPDRALVSIERFVRNVPDRPALFRHLAENPRAIELLVTLLAGSQFLTEILLRTPEYFAHLTKGKQLAQNKDDAEFYREAQAAVAPFLELEQPNGGPLSDDVVANALDALRRFHRWELLRLGADDLLGLLDVPTVTRQLSSLADALIRICLHLAARQLKADPAGFLVVGMGKLGGRELNYSSDIDLLFLSEENGLAYRSLGQRLIQNLTEMMTEGFLYRVDMRLRPWGRTGPLVCSLQAYMDYLNQHARLWEKQALLKARPIAGSEALGSQFLTQIEPLLFETPADMIRADLRATKTRIEEQLRKRGRKWGEVKLGEGSIRDIEFVTQYLQLVHGRETADIRSANTLDALSRLARFGFIATDEHHTLSTGYSFLRSVEHYLQMMRYQQTHTLPPDSEALDHLARRLGFQGAKAGTEFSGRYQQHTAAIRAVYLSHMAETVSEKNDDQTTRLLTKHLSRMAGPYAEIFSEAEIKNHTELMTRLDDDNLIEIEMTPLDDDHWQITIVGYDYLGELSLICGLMYVYRLNIISGHVFTYQSPAEAADHQNGQSKIVDVFIVRPVDDVPTSLNETYWTEYSNDLEKQVHRLRDGEQDAVQRDLINRFADTMRTANEVTAATLYPIDIRIDTETDDRYTILHINTPDTPGFLYEFANALALNGIYIARVTVQTIGTRIQDTLYVATKAGQKITTGKKLFELRAATVLVKHFTQLLPRSPNPAAALTHFREFLGQLFTRPDWPDEIATLIRPDVLDALARLLGVSNFLWDDFLRMQHANLFPIIRDVGALAQAKTKDQLQAELNAIFQFAPDRSAQRQSLNEFKDREMFRIDMRYILGHVNEHALFASELSDLAEIVIVRAYRLCYQELAEQFGDPQQKDGQPCRMAVCALGKFGGRELGFASDVELMFIFDGSGHTNGSEVIRSNLFYERLVQLFQRTIRAKHEGIFELDLRLRPYGKAGSLAVPLKTFRRYFAPDGSAWEYERQALVKLRPIVGNMAFGQEIVALRDKLIYTGVPFDVATMKGMRERQIRHLVTAGTINAKFSPGTLVDIEYLIQGLQISYGHLYPALRVTSTRTALTALRDIAIFSEDDYNNLYNAYNFFRRIINALRMVRGHAKDLTVPATDSEEFAFLARRLNYRDNFSQLRQDLANYTAVVQEINARSLTKIQ